MTAVRRHFSVPQRILHWVMALSILAMLFIGVGMVSTIMPYYLTFVSIHKPFPEPMKLAAHLSHYALYGLMIAMPLIGWAMLSAAAYPVMLFGGLHLPAIVPQSDSLHALLGGHISLAFVFFALILLHVAAALFHALVRRDGVFEAMTSLSTDDAAAPAE